MARKYWLPHALPQQMVLVRNFRAKIESYSAALGLSAADVAEALALCDAFVGAIELTEQCRTTMIAMTAWRDEIIFGSPEGAPASLPPVFPVAAVTADARGVLKQFMRLRDRVVSAPGYTTAIGEDLGIVGPEISRPAAASVTPNLKAVASTGNWVNLTGSMQGMDALRVEYSRDGQNFQTVAFLTTTPGGFQITPTHPNQPEKGVIRAVYIRKNEQVGNFSPSYPVTLV
jgi:hypothetical protein